MATPNREKLKEERIITLILDADFQRLNSCMNAVH